MRKMNRSLSSIAARIRASKDSPGGKAERSRNTECPSPFSDSSMRVAVSLWGEECERKMVLFIVQVRISIGVGPDTTLGSKKHFSCFSVSIHLALASPEENPAKIF